MMAAAILLAAATNAQAATVTVTGGNGVPSATDWGTLPGEDTGGGSGNITATAARSGNGSVELTGDRSRFQIGIQYGGLTNLGSVKDVTGLSYDWRVAADSKGGYNIDQTPALRLLVQDGAQRSELIWEGAYNGTYGNTARDTWYSTTFGDNFYQFVAGSGVTFNNGSQVNKTLASWLSDNYSNGAYVSGISVGVGSGFSSNYHAFADNVTIGRLSGNTTYNFETAVTSAVPEPASWALMIFGFGAVGGSMRRRRTGASLRLA